MVGWLTLTETQRKAVLDQASQLSGISAKAIEKDWWVTLALKALFQSAYATYMVLKGGTSLSKGWKLIARFSEDIDIALAPAAFGMEYVNNPSNTYVKKLKKRGCEFTSDVLKDELQYQLSAMGVPVGMIKVQAEAIREGHPDKDPQTLYISYPSLYDSNPYLPDVVKIEVGVRSLQTPSAPVRLQSILSEFVPLPVYNETQFQVDIAASRKTFLEKLFLLHEEFLKPDKKKIRTQRMSRHLYDIGQMIEQAAGSEALTDDELYTHLVTHRQKYHALGWVDYKSHHPSTIQFLPLPEVLELYRQDYETMREQMIYEEAVPFAELIQRLVLLQGKIRIKHLQDISLMALIKEAEITLEQQQPFKSGNLYTSVIEMPASDEDKRIATIFTLSFRCDEGKLRFEQIGIQA